MLRLNLFTKLFVLLLVCMLFISGALLLSVHWSFTHGFNQYLLQAEANQLDKLSGLLQNEYQKQGNWQTLQANRFVWFDFLRQGLEAQQLPPHAHFPPDDGPQHHRGPPPDHEPPHHPDDHGSGPPPWERHGPPLHEGPDMLAKFLGSRIQLLDAEQHFIAGISKKHRSEYLRPLIVDAQTVGWLSLQSSDLITDHFAQLFIEQQIQHNYFIAAAAIGFALVCSALLARRLISPIKRITAGANLLVSGDYQTQIAVTSQDELGQLAQDFNLLARTLESNKQARRRWIADISHELRTPLAVLRGEIEAVQDGIRDFSPESLKSLHTEVMSLSRLVDDLYELSLSDVGTLHYHKSPCNIVLVLQDVLSNQQPRFQAQQLQLKSEFDPALQLLVLGDSRRLHQLFTNICENTRRYTQPGGFCQVSIDYTPSHIAIRLDDTPPAVPDSALPFLFERLYRVDSSRNRDLGGAGLGLAICHSIVEAHQGTITALHSPFGGLSIVIQLPRLPNLE